MSINWLTDEADVWFVCSVVRKAGNQGHILNLGHGVLVGTPEPSVAHFFDTARSLSYNTEATPQLATSALS
jgi:uroporphyrinogen decarboxylase